jgi:2-polyprenyl-3-methyl-5-hydroxy-6-metoxy-1,4-benzoquinol methylase
VPDTVSPAATTCPSCASEDLRRPFFVKDGYTLDRCNSCGLAFVTNPPTPAELERFYSFDSGYHVDFRDDQDEIANRFELAERQYAAIARHHDVGRCLDIGAAAGFFVKTAADNGWDAHGIELSKDTSQLARERYGVDVTSTRLEDTAFEPESFDAITLWDVIEHVPDPLDTMRRVAALLKPGGVVGIITPNLDGLFARASYHVARLIHQWPAVEPPAHLSQFSVESLTKLLHAVGLDPVEVKHESQPLGYVFGRPKQLLNPKRLLYAAIFAPLMLLGPRVGAGDQMLIIARRPPADSTGAPPS